MEIIDFDSAEDLIDYLRLSKSHWMPEKDQQNRIHSGTSWLFRGQRDAEWRLMPNAFRENCFKPYYSSFTTQMDNRMDRDRKFVRRMVLSWQLQREIEVLNSFIGLADNVGITAPIENLTEIRLLDFYNSIPRNPNEESKFPLFPPEGFLEALALAQHHGVPTRLLDWSYSPLTAAYFAAIGSFEKNQQSDKRFSVWALNIDKLIYENPSSIKVVTAPYSKNEYIKSQRGKFIYDQKANDYFLDHGEWPTLDEVIDKAWKNESDRVNLKKLTLPNKNAKDLLKILYREEINLAHLMPTLDNVNETLLLYTKLFLTD